MAVRLSALFAIAIFILGGIGTYFAISTTQKLNDLTRRIQATEQLNSDVALETRCSEAAAKYYKIWLSDMSSPEAKQLNRGQIITNVQENHWNRRLKKCFVEITSDNSNDGFEFIQVFDALEGKRYGEFDGHPICSSLDGKDQCAMDSAEVWLDGDDQKKQPDSKLGFRGIFSSQSGSADTRDQFLQQIQPLMNN